MNELRIMDKQAGDLKITWDPEKPVEVEAARAAFKEAQAKGMLLYEILRFGKRGETLEEFDPDCGSVGGKVIREFDPKAKRIVATPPVAGG